MERMNLEQIGRMRLMILPGCPGPEYSNVKWQKFAYEYWKNYWQSLLDQISPGEKLNPEHFFDQTAVNVILDGLNVVAMQSIKFYDLRCGLRDHSVFAPFSSDFWKALSDRGIETVFTFRWFRVDEAYGPRKTGVNFSAISNELMHRVFDTHAAPALAGVAHSRVDVAAASVAKKIGWIEAAERQVLHGVPCAQLALFNGARIKYEDETVNQAADLLWAKRESFIEEVPDVRSRAA